MLTTTMLLSKFNEDGAAPIQLRRTMTLASEMLHQKGFLRAPHHWASFTLPGCRCPPKHA
jgi:hypothetical protein